MISSSSSSSLLIVLGLLLSLSVIANAASSGNNNQQQQQQQEEQRRTLRVFRNETAHLPCYRLVDVSLLQVWVAPGTVDPTSDGLVVIGADQQTGTKYAVDQIDGSLTVFGCVKADSGRYKCIQRNGQEAGQYITTETVLEVIDVSYLPEIDDWQANLARGLIAAGSTAVFFILSCGIKHFSWHEKHSNNCKQRQRQRLQQMRYECTAAAGSGGQVTEIGGGDGSTTRLRGGGINKESSSSSFSSSSGVEGSGSSSIVSFDLELQQQQQQQQLITNNKKKDEKTVGSTNNIIQQQPPLQLQEDSMTAASNLAESFVESNALLPMNASSVSNAAVKGGEEDGRKQGIDNPAFLVAMSQSSMDNLAAAAVDGGGGGDGDGTAVEIQEMATTNQEKSTTNVVVIIADSAAL